MSGSWHEESTEGGLAGLLLRWARERPDGECLIQDDRVLTWAQADRVVERQAPGWCRCR